MKTLVLAEKPSVAREIARILGCNQKVPGGIQNSNYIITWALGHLVTLAMPEDYDNKYQNWDASMLPIIPEKFKTIVIKETSKQYNLVKDFLKDKDVKELVIATDAGREGELVARLIIKQARFDKPMKRLWISSMTDAAIKDGFKNLVSASKYDSLYYSAMARAKSDWIVGLNVTRALSCRFNAKLNAGRVQTPTIAMVVEREKEINSFKPVPYYNVLFVYPYKNKKINFTYENVNKNVIETRIYQEDELKNLINEIDKANPTVKEVITKEKRKGSPLLYDLTELQRDANKMYGLSPKQTLDIIQILYERHKVLTYPRTDSRYLTSDMYSTIKERLKAINYGNFSQIINQINSKPLKNNKNIFDNNKVSDHHAIIPTEQKPNIAALSNMELKIYELVIKRFLAVFLDDYEYLETKVVLNIKGKKFTTRGKTEKNIGWKIVYKKDALDDEEDLITDLPNFEVNETLTGGKIETKKLLTTPPSRYTEATILSAMEHPAKFVTSNNAKTILEDTGGLGTPATRADILDKLFTNGYLELNGKSIFPTSKGKQLIDLVPEQLRSPLLTANYETRLKKIAEGKEKDELFLKDIISETKSMVNEVLNSDSNYRHDNITTKKCPECGNPLLEVNNKSGKSLVCSSPTCKYRKVMVRHTMVKCPNCFKKLDLIGDYDNGSYQCSCGFKEKTTTFKERISEKKKEMSKKDIANYLKKQNNDIPKDNPFSDFFK